MSKVLRLGVKKLFNVQSRGERVRVYSHAIVRIPKSSDVYYSDEVVVMDLKTARTIASYLKLLPLKEGIDPEAVEFLKVVGDEPSEEKGLEKEKGFCTPP